MTTMADIRKKYPQYSDLSDDTLLRGLHAKNYSDISYDDFAAKVDDAKAAPAVESIEPEAKAYPYQDERGNWIKGPHNRASDDLQGFGTTVLNGQFMGAGDEIVAGGRTLIDMFNPDSYGEGTQDFSDTYDMYLADAEEAKQRYRRENPVGSVATEMTAGVANPLNKVKMLTRGAGYLPRTIEALVRGGLEGTAAGWLENNEDRAAGAKTGAKYGAGIAAGLTGLTGALSNERVRNQLVQWVDDGKGGMKRVFQPLNMADPESLLGKFYRNTVGVSFGGGKIGVQESNYLNNAPQFARYADPNTGLVVPQTTGTKHGLDDAVERVTSVAKDTADDIDAQAAARIGGLTQTKEAIEASADAAKLESRSRLNTTAAQVEDIASVNKAAEADNFRQLAGQEAFPDDFRVEATADLDMADPIAVSTRLKNWWTKNGFDMVKRKRGDDGFVWDLDLVENVRSKFSKDPGLILSLSEAPEMIEMIGRKFGLSDELLKHFKSGNVSKNEISTVMDAMFNPELKIDGDALMEIRNFFAKAASKVYNSDPSKSRAYSVVKRQFDDFIESGLDDISVEQYRDQIARWTTHLNYREATRRASKAGGRFSAENWIDGGKKYGDSSLGEQPLQSEGVATIANRTYASGEQKSQLAKAKAQKLAEDEATAAAKKKGLAEATKQIKAEEEARKAAVRANKNELSNARSEIKRAGRGVLAEDPSVGNKAVATAVMGLPLGGIGFKTIPAGIGTAKLASTEAGQLAVAGQLNIQKALAAALRDGDLDRYISLLSRQTALSGSGE